MKKYIINDILNRAILIIELSKNYLKKNQPMHMGHSKKENEPINGTEEYFYY